MPRNQVSATYFLPPEQLAELKRIAIHRRVPQAVLVRTALELLFEQARAGTLTVGQPRDE